MTATGSADVYSNLLKPEVSLETIVALNQMSSTGWTYFAFLVRNIRVTSASELERLVIGVKVEEEVEPREEK